MKKEEDNEEHQDLINKINKKLSEITKTKQQLINRVKKIIAQQADIKNIETITIYRKNRQLCNVCTYDKDNDNINTLDTEQ